MHYSWKHWSALNGINDAAAHFNGKTWKLQKIEMGVTDWSPTVGGETMKVDFFILNPK